MKYRLLGSGTREKAGKSLTPVAFSLVPFVICLALSTACGPSARLSGFADDGLAADLLLPEDLPRADSPVTSAIARASGHVAECAEDPVLMRAVIDEQTGEKIAVDMLDAAVIKARFMHVAERNGVVKLTFRINVPESAMDPEWQLRLHPVMLLPGRECSMDDVLVTGEKFRQSQLHGYELYDRFISRIIADSLDFIDMRSLEMFIARNIPELYALRRDSCLVDSSEFESAFGVTPEQVAEHYTRKFLQRRNERLESMKGEKFRKYVGSPIVAEGVRLDTVVLEGSGNFVYDYVQIVPASASLRKISVRISGEIYGRDGLLRRMRDSETMTFYVSSISSLRDTLRKYEVRNRDAYVEGLNLLEQCRYQDALELLLPYRDYNTALALVALGRDGFARELLLECQETARTNYLLAIVSARAGMERAAFEYLLNACRQDPSMRHRARLDPEVSGLADKYGLDEFIQNS